VYLLLHNDVDIGELKQKTAEFIMKYADKDNASQVQFVLQPLKNIHLDSNLAREIIPNSKRSYLRIFMFIGLFILLAALFNFINLYLTQVSERYGEIGIRKVLGAGNKEVMGIVLFESIMYNLMALTGGILLAYFAFPFVRSLTVIHFIYSFWPFALSVILMALLTGIAGGLTAAYLAWRIDPVKVLKDRGQIFGGGKRNIFKGRKVLTILQFTLSLLLIGSAFVASEQFSYMNKKNLGISPEQVMVINNIPNKVTQKYNALRTEISSLGGVNQVAGCMEVPSREIRDSGPVLVRGINEDKDKAPVIDVQVIDENFLDLLKIGIVSGKNIRVMTEQTDYPEFGESLDPKDYFRQVQRDYVINETAMRALGWNEPEEAIGQFINWQINPYELAMGPIVGVISDYHQESLKNRIDPLVLFYEPIWIRTLLIKVNTEHIDQTISEIKSVWDRMFPSYPMNYSFLDEMYTQLYQVDRAKLNLLYVLAGLAVFNGFLGLFAIVAYTINLRMKEMTIRKVVGAGPGELLALVGKEYIFYLLGSGLVAIPISYYWVYAWLQNFSYRIPISALTYVFALFLLLAIVLLTVGYHIFRLQKVNPTDILKIE
jgi:putative ABC transport system permease protein